MKDVLSLIAVTLAVLLVSTSSLKRVSSASMPVKEEQTQSVKESEVKKGKENKKAEKKQSDEQQEAAQEISEQPAEQQVEEQQEPTAEEAEPAEQPAQDPAPAVQPTPVVNVTPVQYYDFSSVASTLNSAPLNPSYTGCDELNGVINSILSQITNSSMSTYEKVKACYAYIINTCSEGYIYGSYSYKTGGWNVNAQALALFSEHRGMCDCYSAGFTVLCRAIGLNCSQVEGDIPYYTDHDWCEINIGGTRFIFDPDVEEDRTHSATEYYFCKTYSQLPEYYYKRTIG